MKIGSDELILWLRKNKKSEKESNEQIGKKIRILIRDKFKIDPIVYDQQSHWANKSGDKNIDAYNLPKTSAQYDIDIVDFFELYRELNDWK